MGAPTIDSADTRRKIAKESILAMLREETSKEEPTDLLPTKLVAAQFSYYYQKISYGCGGRLIGNWFY